MPTLYIGADVAKDKLDLDLNGRAIIIANTPAGYRQGLARLAQLAGPVQVVLEASGGYEQGFLRALQTAAVLVSLVQPKRVREYANAKGQLAKTDAIDAKVLSLFGAAMCPRPTPPPPAALAEVRELSRYRGTLVEAQTAVKLRLQQEHHLFIMKDLRGQLRDLQARIAKVEARLKAVLAQVPELREKLQVLMQQPGIGLISAVLLLSEMPELGTLNRGEVAALAGVAPYARDSGKHRGRRHVGPGRDRVREGLYMPTLAAIQHDPHLAARYARLCARGKLAKVAQVAVMRHLLIQLNARLKEHAAYTAA